MGRPLLLLAGGFVLLIGGCAQVPTRTAADGHSFIPLEGFGATLSHQGLRVSGHSVEMSYESLYVWCSFSKKEPFQDIVRFWSNGSGLNRTKWENDAAKADDMRISAYDGQFVNDWISAPGPESRDHFSQYGYPLKWCVYNGHMYIEVFDFTPEGRVFIVKRGPVTAGGFILNERRYNTIFGSKWQPITPRHYIKQHVGKMIGKPTW